MQQIWNTRIMTENTTSSTLEKNSDIPTATAVISNGKVVKRKRSKKNAHTATTTTSSPDGMQAVKTMFEKAASSQEGILIRRILAVMLWCLAYMIGSTFTKYSWRLAKDLSHPSIIIKARTREGRIVKVDDYRDAYKWIRDETPEDARIMAWWDYGYQITAIANRTTLADGNTWNHEHIALLGKALTTEITEGHEIARHLADYVLLWGGGGGDDLAKSPHLARIANSVYRDHCPKDPTCRAFGFVDHQGTPSPMMERSLLYQLHGHGLRPGVTADPDLFKEVFRSKYGRVRIFKVLQVDESSKAWVADPNNRKCDVPGSWFCPGQYPPGLSKILGKKKDFRQLEDFNRGNRKNKNRADSAGSGMNGANDDDDDDDAEYQKEYFAGLNNPDAAQRRAMQNEAYKQQEEKQRQKKLMANGRRRRFTVNSDGTTTRHDDPDPEETTTPEEREAKDAEIQRKIQQVYNNWQDTEETTLMWSIISQNEVDELRFWIQENPLTAYIRSKDGRGPMWWAFEARNQEIVKILMKAGVPHTDKDAMGLTPVDLLKGNEEF